MVGVPDLLRKTSKWILLLIIVGVILYAVKFRPVPVMTAAVTTGAIVGEVMGTGTLEAHYQSSVSSKISGLLVELPVDQNDRVTKGQRLARLDDSDFRWEVTTQEAVVQAEEAAVERAKADLVKSTAIFDQTKRDYDRYMGLRATNSISQEAMDKNAQNLAVADADVSRATAAIAEAERRLMAAKERLRFQQARLGDTVITAPFDGLIIRRDREIGDVVVPGASIFQLLSSREMWVSAWVDESAMSAVATGQPARVVFRSQPAVEYTGKVVRLGREVDRETREFRVDVGVTELPENWAVGQRAEVYIRTASKPAAVLISSKAITWRRGKAGVFVMHNSRALWRPITLGLHGRGQTEVTKGVSPDETLIVGPDLNALKDNQRVYAK